MAGNLVPRSDGGSSLGTASKEYNKVYAKDLGGTVAGLYAKLNSPTFTGTPTAPTAAVGTATTQIATTKFVADAVKETVHNRQETTTYYLGDLAGHQTLPYGWFLECTVAGTTDSGALTISTPTVGGTVTDGTCTWTIRRTASVADGVFNHKETFASSGSFTAPYTGTYRISLKGGGGGGGGSSAYGTGAGGGQGGNLVFYEKLTAGTSYSYTIGAGGSGGAIGVTGSNGGASSITINGNAYVCNGGKGGSLCVIYSQAEGGYGGTCTVNGTTVNQGLNGHMAIFTTDTTLNVGWVSGGGSGNGCGGYGARIISAGGARTTYAGEAGGDGFIQFEYCEM